MSAKDNELPIPGSILAMLGGIVLTVTSVWVGQNHGLMPVSASTSAPEVDGLFNFMMTVSTGLFLLVEGVLIYSLFAFRKKPGDDTDGPPIDGNLSLEILWTGIPVFIVLALAIYSFEAYNNMGGLDPSASGKPPVQQLAANTGNAIAAPLPNGETPQPRSQVAVGFGATPDSQGRSAAVNVDVNGLQFAWIFTYPDSGIVTGELHVPVNEDVQLNITAADVIHAFWIPEFRLKQDAIPGQPTQMRFKPTLEGTYPIVCAELCGAYHGAMRSQIVVESAEDYQAWVESQVAAGTPTETVAAMDDRDRLAAHAKDMDVSPQVLHQLHHHH